MKNSLHYRFMKLYDRADHNCIIDRHDICFEFHIVISKYSHSLNSLLQTQFSTPGRTIQQWRGVRSSEHSFCFPWIKMYLYLFCHFFIRWILFLNSCISPGAFPNHWEAETVLCTVCAVKCTTLENIDILVEDIVAPFPEAKCYLPFDVVLQKAARQHMVPNCFQICDQDSFKILTFGLI